jgi:hypothetical protein
VFAAANDYGTDPTRKAFDENTGRLTDQRLTSAESKLFTLIRWQMGAYKNPHSDRKVKDLREAHHQLSVMQRQLVRTKRDLPHFKRRSFNAFPG